MNPLKVSLTSSTKPKYFKNSESIKKGNREGKTLFFQILKEKVTDEITNFDSFKISNPKKIKLIIITELVKIFFIKYQHFYILKLKGGFIINKTYAKAKEFIKDTYKVFIVFIIAQIFLVFPLNYYIDKPGGIIDISDKIEIKNKPKNKGSLNFAYVLEGRATPFTFLLAKFNKDHKIIKKSDIVYDNETIKNMNFRDHLLLEEANDNATIVAYKKLNKNIKIKEEKLFVTYIDKIANTNLKIEDQIIEINGNKIKSRNELQDLASKLKENDKIIIKVKNNKKTYERYAVIKKEKDKAVIGIMVSTDRIFETNPELKIKTEESESGPSGGLMMSLSIYNAISKEDITKGRKIVGTGTIDENGKVGPIGGIEFKLKGAVKEKADIFLVPAGKNYDDAIKLKKERNYKIKIKKISTFNEALKYLKK